mgnify:CR=1 FL=1
MAYLGNDLQVAYPTYKNIDDISSSFNGSTTSFALRVGGVAPVPLPLNSQQCLISVAGVLQRPDDTGSEGFKLSGGNIVFSSAPASGADFFGVILAGADYVNVGANFPSGSAAVPSVTFDSSTTTGLYLVTTNTLGVATGGINALTVDANQKIGIGTTSPTGKFTLSGGNAIGVPAALTDGATITADFSTANNFTLTLGGNRTLANPTNLTAGQSGVIVITQDGTGSRTLAYGSYWKFPSGTAPTLTTTASAVDVLAYYVESATRITARMLNDVK